MAQTPTGGNEGDERVQADIQKYGCHVISVFDPDGTKPPFSYSIGVQKTTGKPDAIVIGLDHKLGHSMVNKYSRRVREGEIFERGNLYSGFLQGFEIYIEPIPRGASAAYTFGCDRYYGLGGYDMVQLVWPSTSGLWPWELGVSEWFITNQPMLGRNKIDGP